MAGFSSVIQEGQCEAAEWGGAAGCGGCNGNEWLSAKTFQTVGFAIHTKTNVCTGTKAGICLTT